MSTRPRAAFLRQKALEKPCPSLLHVSHHIWHIPELTCLVLPGSGNLHSDTYTSAGDIARWGSFPVSYLFCHSEPPQQSHKFLLEVWLLKQKNGRKKDQQNYQTTFQANIQAMVILSNMLSRGPKSAMIALSLSKFAVGLGTTSELHKKPRSGHEGGCKDSYFLCYRLN